MVGTGSSEGLYPPAEDAGEASAYGLKATPATFETAKGTLVVDAGPQLPGQVKGTRIVSAAARKDCLRASARRAGGGASSG